MNWYTGFISLQIEHHLFPRMPTSGLEIIQPHVRAFFKTHGLEYREDSLWGCLCNDMAALHPGAQEKESLQNKIK